MRTEKEIKYLIWAFDSDPHAEQITDLLQNYLDSIPTLETVKETIFLAEKLYRRGNALNQGDYVPFDDLMTLTWLSKKLYLLSWLLEKDDMLEKVSAVPYSGWHSLYKRVTLFKEAYEGEEDG